MFSRTSNPSPSISLKYHQINYLPRIQKLRKQNVIWLAVRACGKMINDIDDTHSHRVSSSLIFFNLINIIYYAEEQTKQKRNRETNRNGCIQSLTKLTFLKIPVSYQQNRILEFKSILHADFLFSLSKFSMFILLNNSSLEFIILTYY